MKERDAEGFRARVAAARANGKTLTEAIAIAYAWLLLPSKKAHPRR